NKAVIGKIHPVAEFAIGIQLYIAGIQALAAGAVKHRTDIHIGTEFTFNTITTGIFAGRQGEVADSRIYADITETHITKVIGTKDVVAIFIENGNILNFNGANHLTHLKFQAVIIASKEHFTAERRLAGSWGKHHIRAEGHTIFIKLIR